MPKLFNSQVKTSHWTQMEGLQTAAQDNGRRRRQVKEAAVEKKGVRHNSPITKDRWHICGCSRSLRSFLGWRKPGLGTADVSEKATVRKSEKSASHRPRTCQRNNCPRSFKANRNICLDITSPGLQATNGLFMLTVPRALYYFVPGVTDTGSFNCAPSVRTHPDGACGNTDAPLGPKSRVGFRPSPQLTLEPSRRSRG